MDISKGNEMGTNGYIKTTVKTNDVTGQREAINYEWTGGDNLSISYMMSKYIDVKPNKFCYIGPYKVYCYGMDGMTNNYLCMRIRSSFWFIPVITYKLTRWLDLVYRRTIITLCVWKLANYQEGLLPSISDVYLVKTIKGWLHGR